MHSTRDEKTDNHILSMLTPFEKFTKDFDTPLLPFSEIFEITIKPVVESPYLFNSFNWVTNIYEQKLVYVSGVEKLLGYKDADFTLEKSIEIIHPNYQYFVVEYALMAYKMLQERRYRSLSTRSHYCIQYPVKRADGKYILVILVQSNISIIQTDKDDNPISNYNRFELLGPFLNAPIVIRPRVYFRTTARWEDLEIEAENELSKRVSIIMLERLKITPRELLILQDFADDLSSLDITEKQNIGIETIKTHSKKILKKARIHLSPNFCNIKEVALYLKNIDII